MALDNSPNTTLPLPSSRALAHCERVQAAIRRSILEQGPLAFGDFMQFVLHAPGFGYYAAGNEKIGAQGDFITAPLISELFARCLAQQLRPVLQETAGDVLEIGAGTGDLALSILRSSQLADVNWGRYFILEPSADLAQRQVNLLQQGLPADTFSRLEWLNQLPQDFSGCVVANEVVDAMPVEQFLISRSDSAVLQCCVDLIDDELCLSTQAASQPLCDAVATLESELGYAFSPGYCSEVNLLLAPWLRSLSSAIKRGLLLLIDYGYPAKEYYLPERERGTLRCYYRHFVHEQLLLYPGLQDITADVDFTRAAKAAVAAGFELHGYTSQAQFLLGNGLLEHAESVQPGNDQERFQLAQQIHTLSSPAAMGDRFQVMGLSKSLELDLQGFSQADFSHRL